LANGLGELKARRHRSRAQTELRPPWLIVEDEALVAMLIEDAISDMGLAPIGPASRVSRALALIAERPPKGAILDVNLAGEPVYPVADALAAQGIPFLFLTGYAKSGIPRHFEKTPIVGKPFTIEQIQAAVRQLQEALS
jgi:CheY-like chemotaxis protein